MQTHYDILGEQPGASESDLESAYHRRAHLLHPDHHTGAPPEVRAEAEKWMRELNASWAVLRSPDLRAQYDAILREASASTPSGPPYDTSQSDRASHGPPVTVTMTATAVPARPRPRRSQEWGQIATISMIAATTLTVLVLLLSFAVGPG